MASVEHGRVARDAQPTPPRQASVRAQGRRQGGAAGGASFGEKALRSLSSISLLLLVFLMGILVTWNGLWPFEPHIRNALLGLEALSKTYVAERHPYNMDVWRLFSAEEQPRGVTKHDAATVYDGYTLVVYGQSAALVDMTGEVVHHWHLPVEALEGHGVSGHGDSPDTWFYWKPAQVLPNGELIAIVDEMHFTPEGLALVKLDRDSQPIWVLPGAVHHDFDIGPDGRIYVLDQTIQSTALEGLPSLVPPFLDEGVLVVSPAGETLARVSIAEAFQRSPYRSMLDEFALINRDAWGDYLHSNNVDVVDAEMAAAFDFLEEGQVILSLREISAIAAMDIEERRIVWAARGQWHMQHDPDLLPNGNILLFDNQGDWSRPSRSRVIEFDPKSGGIVWQFPARAGQDLFSPFRAHQEKLPNGNVLINDFQNGRLIEVTSGGDVVWEYHCPFVHPEREELLCRPMSAKRYGRGELIFLDGEG